MENRARYVFLVGLVVLALVISGCKGRKAIPDLPAEEEMLLLEAEGNSTVAPSPTAAAEDGGEPAAPTAEAADGSGTTPQGTEVAQPTATEAPAVGEVTTPQVEATTESGQEPSPVVSASGERLHVVQAGQNLFRIAMMYGTSIEAIAAAVYGPIPGRLNSLPKSAGSALFLATPVVPVQSGVPISVPLVLGGSLIVWFGIIALLAKRLQSNNT